MYLNTTDEVQNPFYSKLKCSQTREIGYRLDFSSVFRRLLSFAFRSRRVKIADR